MMRLVVIILCGLAFTNLVGCALMQPPPASYVTPAVTVTDAHLLADDAVEYLSYSLAPAQTTIVIDPPSPPDIMTPMMVDKLRNIGYGVILINKNPGKYEPPETGIRLRYLVSSLNNGILMRLQYQGIEAACFYQSSQDGHLLRAAAPFTVRQIEASQSEQATTGISK